MKKLLFLLGCMLSLLIMGCSNQSDEEQNNAEEETSDETVTYESETGPVEIPADPQRIVALSNGPNVFALDGNLVGVDEWTKASPLFEEGLADVEVVSENDPESILALEPDLIIAGSHMENLDELEKIAPTVIYTWGKLDYLQQHLEIGKLLNKEEEAQEWMDDFSERAKAVGDKIKEEHGEDVSVSVFETDSKNFSVFGDNWARGTEILYQAMELTMPEKVQEDALADGYYSLSLETLPEYAGDFIVLSEMGAENEFTKSETWQSIPAVENNQVIAFNTEEATYSDPVTLEHLLAIFEEGFLE
ncbi:iron-hydroxamate ABC transporter substrate-binding protein [Oceanobacillus timonensis]|uniref:iron-hydroxamate ABC transporter substrate-binding protein n=1 Tax=Oceanobacillus timonensis TaxID=1926285 RepID=UPI0009BC359E|nr:iron-hydroxamate ABC transporter substrate-binding protein [Oceanobacillus timonensis]